MKAPFVFPALSVILPFALSLKGGGEVTLNFLVIRIISVVGSTEFAIERKFDSEWLRYEWISVSFIQLECPRVGLTSGSS